MAIAPQQELTLNEAAQHVRLSIDTLRRAITRNHLPAHQVGGHKVWRINVDDLDRWYASGAPTGKQTETEKADKEHPG